ncbi:unnamed protein product [Adineta ricciae]|uniref:Uncharacterized protein n=1 Tax=Adineta ricciae TaxID=249248 RepID=A0A816DXM9_ADIRI|nr:unnamed protein product [Adineta ricciae]
MNDEQVHQNYLFDNHRRLFHKTKLKAISRTSALLSGFAMIAMVEISFDDYKDAVTPMPLIVIYISLTCLVVGVHLFALMLSSCILPLFEIHHLFTCRERDIIYVYAEFAWILSTCVGIVLFVVQMVVVCWIKFLFLTRQAAIVTTSIIVPILILYCTFSVHFFRRLLFSKLSYHQNELDQLEKRSFAVRFPRTTII